TCSRALLRDDERPYPLAEPRAQACITERHDDDDDALDDLHHLGRHVRVDDEPTLRERPEEERREDDAREPPAPEDRHGEPREACARAEPALEVAFVTEH